MLYISFFNERREFSSQSLHSIVINHEPFLFQHWSPVKAVYKRHILHILMHWALTGHAAKIRWRQWQNGEVRSATRIPEKTKIILATPEGTMSHRSCEIHFRSCYCYRYRTNVLVLLRYDRLYIQQEHDVRWNGSLESTGSVLINYIYRFTVHFVAVIGVFLYRKDKNLSLYSRIVHVWSFCLIIFVSTLVTLICICSLYMRLGKHFCSIIQKIVLSYCMFHFSFQNIVIYWFLSRCNIFL